jgi:AraC-like DNA-binding protein
MREASITGSEAYALSNEIHLPNGLGRSLPALRTTEAEVARSHLGGLFAHHDLVLKDHRIDFVHQQACLCDVSISFLGYGSQVQVIAPPLPDFYLFQLTLTGRVFIRASRFDVVLEPGSVFVMNPGIAYRKQWSRDAQQLMLKIPRQRLEARLREELDEDALRPVAFESHPGADDDRRNALLRLLDYLCRDLAASQGLMAAASFRRDMENALLSAILAALPHDQSNVCGHASSPAAPYYVRRAETYLRESISRPVSLDELARVAGVSARSLQTGFRRFRDKTPAQFSREVRLDLARQALGTTAAGERSVTKVALEFGFAHLGRFARSYLDRFGETPSATLRRVRY